jgi:hypothetical protein
MIQLEGQIKTASRQDYYTLTTDLTGILGLVGAANVNIIQSPAYPYTPFVMQITGSVQIGRC